LIDCGLKQKHILHTSLITQFILLHHFLLVNIFKTVAVLKQSKMP